MLVTNNTPKVQAPVTSFSDYPGLLLELHDRYTH